MQHLLLLEDSVLVHAAALVVGVDALEALIRHFTEAGKSAVAAKLMWALWAIIVLYLCLMHILCYRAGLLSSQSSAGWS